MTITSIRTWQPIAQNSPPDWRTSLGQIAVSIETDEGLVGYGVGGGGAAGMHVIKSLLGPLLTGRDPEPVERLWDEMYDNTLAFGRKGIAIMAISGIDLALWDLRAKSQDRSVAEILGGPSELTVPTYTTVWDVVDDETAMSQEAVKLHVGATRSGHPVQEIVDCVRAAREAIGTTRELMIDAWMKWDVDTTLSIAEQIAPLNISWIEEPLSPDDLAGYELLRDASPIPIAGGEHEFTAHGFREIIERRLHTVLQPDVNWVGGMTELVKIYKMAEAAGLRVVPHRGSEVWGLHGLAALDPHPLAESPRPWMTWVRGQPEVRDGSVQLSSVPGFGVILENGTSSI